MSQPTGATWRWLAMCRAKRAMSIVRKKYATDPEAARYELSILLETTANILGSLGRLDEALALDREWMKLNPGRHNESPEAFLRTALNHIAHDEDAEAEKILRPLAEDIPEKWDKSRSHPQESRGLCQDAHPAGGAAREEGHGGGAGGGEDAEGPGRAAAGQS
jgi:tetratricopeptide (TPR) repeat protein